MRTFAAPVFRILSASLPALVGAANANIGRNGGDHQAEAVVQYLMRSALTPHLPCPHLIRENEKLGPPVLSAMIPDLIIDKIEGGYWGIFEIKTLLRDDPLSVTDVDRDLEKLCRYKKCFPNTAAIFALIGSKTKRRNSARSKAWRASKIRYETSLFMSCDPTRQAINADFAAIPCSASPEDSDVQTFLWEIHPTSANSVTVSACYRFQAEMLA